MLYSFLKHWVKRVSALRPQSNNSGFLFKSFQSLLLRSNAARILLCVQHVNMFMIAPLEMQARVCDRIKFIFIHDDKKLKLRKKVGVAMNEIVGSKIYSNENKFYFLKHVLCWVVEGSFTQFIISFPSSTFCYVHHSVGNYIITHLCLL